MEQLYVERKFDLSDKSTWPKEKGTYMIKGINNQGNRTGGHEVWFTGDTWTIREGCSVVSWLEPIEDSTINDWDGVKFYNWLHEEGYSFSDARYCVYLGGKNYWIWDVYKKYKGLPIEESEQEELFDDVVHEVGKFFADETNEVSREEFVKELSKQYHLIKK